MKTIYNKIKQKITKITEILYIYSIPGFIISIKKIDQTENWSKSRKYEKDETW